MERLLFSSPLNRSVTYMVFLKLILWSGAAVVFIYNQLLIKPNFERHFLFILPFLACLVKCVHVCVSCCLSLIICDHFTAHSWHLMGSLSATDCCSRNTASTNCPVLPFLLMVGHPRV